MVVLFEPENFYQSFRPQKKRGISTRDTHPRSLTVCPWKVTEPPIIKDLSSFATIFQGRTVKLRGFYGGLTTLPKKNLHFEIEALGCLSSFSGAYHDSEICVGGHHMGFSLAIRQHLSIRCNLVPKVFGLHLLVPSRTVGRLQVNACRHGLVPMGGMTYVLGTSTLFNQAANHQITVDGSEIRRSKTSWGNGIWHPHYLPWVLPPSNRWVSLGISEASNTVVVRLASLPWHLGEFLALTAWPLRGADLVSLDLLEFLGWVEIWWLRMMKMGHGLMIDIGFQCHRRCVYIYNYHV